MAEPALVETELADDLFVWTLGGDGIATNYEDADVGNLENGIRFLRSLGARTYVPGHGSAGGTELLDSQARYHSAIRTAARSSSDAAAAPDRIRSLFPGYHLEEVLPAALTKNR